ncbi:MAG: helix-turn-helix domain-containing protein [Ktedonobacterales bacterium]
MIVAFEPEPPSTSSVVGMSRADAQSSFILRDVSRQYYWQGSGFLSIKSFFGGRALYSVGGGFCAVDDQSYLILNQGQSYTISIDSASPVESCCLFFSPRLAREVYHSLSTPVDALIEAPLPGPGLELPDFFERTYPQDALVSPALVRLRHAISTSQRLPSSGWLAEQSRDVLCRLLVAQRAARMEMEALPGVRAATREELYRRLHRARDFVLALSSTPITLDDMARVANLSPTHFLRTFKQAFHETPHHYLTTQRLERAQQLLRQTDRPVTDICFAVGFESLGSFSTLFKRRLGYSPQRFRQAWRKKTKGDFEEAAQSQMCHSEASRR